VKAECIEGGWGRARKMGIGGGLAGAAEKEGAGEGDAGAVLGGSAAFDQLDEADHRDDGADEVEQAVGDEAGRQGRAVVDVVPPEELVEDDLVQGAGETDAGQDGRPEQGRTGTRGRFPPPPR
jgi:hypothetical protein